jgi:pimeloyl-ACP methyl ester carboxylesterase
MALELTMDSGPTPANAIFLGTACDLAYLNDPEASAAFKEKLGLVGRVVAAGNTQVFVGANDEHIVAAFRGTESPTTIDGLKDWLLTNAVNFLVLPEGDIGTDFAAAGVGARFHQGFMVALAQVWDSFFEAVKALRDEKKRPIWLTGHSLGGALAVLAAWRLEQKFIQVHKVYTYGAPMVGNSHAAEAFSREFDNRIYRYVDARDFIPFLPTISLIANTYTHCLREMPVTGGSEPAAEATIQALNSKTEEGTLTPNVIEELWASLKERISAHLMGNYLQCVSQS